MAQLQSDFVIFLSLVDEGVRVLLNGDFSLSRQGVRHLPSGGRGLVSLVSKTVVEHLIRLIVALVLAVSLNLFTYYAGLIHVRTIKDNILSSSLFSHYHLRLSLILIKLD